MSQTYDRQSYESWDDYVLRKLKEEREYLKKNYILMPEGRN